jgi:hypothetical protein
VARGFLRAATHDSPPAIPEKQSGRRELGEWLANPANPLTARVMANRVWNWLFGAGLVRTADNFGTAGEAPSHPELLDYLAIRFLEEGWSVKKLVREIVLSQTYQLSSLADSERRQASQSNLQPPTSGLLSSAIRKGQELDPENRLFWRMNHRRLDAECIRDTMLFVSGQLQFDMGGSTIQPGTSADYGYKHTEKRRSVYVPVFRNALPDVFEVFDFADPSMVTGRRNASTVAPQALFFMNHPFVMEQAQHAAKRILAMPAQENRARVERAYRIVLGRSPTEGELALALKYLGEDLAGANNESVRLEAWAQFCQGLFASVDFRFVN